MLTTVGYSSRLSSGLDPWLYIYLNSRDATNCTAIYCGGVINNTAKDLGGCDVQQS